MGDEVTEKVVFRFIYLQCSEFNFSLGNLISQLREGILHYRFLKCIILIDSDTHKNADCFGSDVYFNATCFNASAISNSELFYSLLFFNPSFITYFRGYYLDIEALNLCFFKKIYRHISFCNITKLMF